MLSEGPKVEVVNYVIRLAQNVATLGIFARLATNSAAIENDDVYDKYQSMKRK